MKLAAVFLVATVAAVCLIVPAKALLGAPKWHQLESAGPQGGVYTFDQYRQHFGKIYETDEELASRRVLFERSLAEVMQHNKGQSTWKAGINHMSDWTPQEFQRLLGRDRSLARAQALVSKAPKASFKHIKHSDLPSSIDWRLKGAVTPVKDQGHCGSCWTFAAAETLEAHWFLKTGQMMELSEQQIAGCTFNPHQCGGAGGCEGGIAELAFASVIHVGGIASEWTYPYISHKGKDFPCQFNFNNSNSALAPVANFSSYMKLETNNYDDLLAAVATIGPIAISVDASSWSKYESGVYSGCNMTGPSIDHAVQLVGYGVDGDSPYWLVRNSWTPTWGENGYIRIARLGAQGEPPCGVDTDPAGGFGCTPGPANVTVCGMCGILSDSAFPIV